MNKIDQQCLRSTRGPYILTYLHNDSIILFRLSSVEEIFQKSSILNGLNLYKNGECYISLVSVKVIIKSIWLFYNFLSFDWTRVAHDSSKTVSTLAHLYNYEEGKSGCRK